VSEHNRLGVFNSQSEPNDVEHSLRRSALTCLTLTPFV
jgi:hypothetical protein